MLVRTREERETHIWRSDADDVWWIFTESPAMIRKLEKVAQAQGIELERVGEGIRCRLPHKWVRISVSRQYTPEQKAALAARLRKRRNQ